MAEKKKIGAHKYLLQNVFIIALIALVPVVIISIFAYYRMTRVVNEELITANTRILNLTMNTVESLIAQVKNNCQFLKSDEVFLNFRDVEYDIPWYENKKEFSNYNELLSMYNYLRLKRRIFERLEAETWINNFVESAYFIDYRKNIIMTSRRELLQLEYFYDPSLLDLLNSRNETWGLIERYEVDSRGNGNDVLTVYYDTRSQWDYQAFVINIHTSRFYEYLNRRIFEENGDSFYMIRDNRVILEPLVHSQLLDEDIINRLGQTEYSGPLSWRIGTGGGEDHYLTAVYSRDLRWWFISFTETSRLLKTSNYIQQMIIITSIILGICILVSIMVWTYYWYKPIRMIITDIRKNLFGKSLPGNIAENEFKIIADGFKTVFTEREFLQNRITEMLPSFRDKYIMNLLKGTITAQDGSKIPSSTVLAGSDLLPLKDKNLAVIVMEINRDENAENSLLSEGGMTLLVYAMEIINSAAKAVTSQFYVLSDEYERIILIINIEEDNRYEIFSLCTKICEQISTFLQSRCYMGISRIHNTMDELCDAFSEAQQALSWSIFFPNAPVTYIEDIQPYKSNHKWVIIELPMSFFTVIRAGMDREAIDQLMGYVKAVGIRNARSAQIRINDIFLYLLSKLMDLADELNINNDEMVGKISTIHQCLLQRNEAAALEGVKGIIRDLATVYRKGLSVQNNNRVSRARSILDEKYSSASISLSSVAEEVGINPDYLGRIFREEIGINFVDYLTNLRIQKSVELLKTTDMQIKEISITVGYNNPTYFIKIFKERFNVTPKEFKNNMISVN